MNVIELTDDNFEAELAGAELAVVDFYAGWCGQCRMFMPKYKRMAKKYPGVRFFKVNGETSPATRKSVEIPALPFFATYKSGTQVGGQTTTKLESFEKLLTETLGAEAAE